MLRRPRRAVAVTASVAAGALAIGGVAIAATTLNPETNACPPQQTSNQGFSDVTSSTPFANSIYCVADLGIAAGQPDGTYRPNDTLSRRQMATFYYRLACSLEYEPANESDPGPTADQCREVLDTSDNGFTDMGGVAGEQADAINFLANVGVVQGTGGGQFSPNAPITRAQMAAFIDRFQAYGGHKSGEEGEDVSQAGVSGEGNTGFVSDGSVDFSDIGGSVLAQHIRDIASAGVTGGVGDGSRYAPNEPLPRRQMAEFLARHMEFNAQAGNWVFETVA